VFPVRYELTFIFYCEEIYYLSAFYLLKLKRLQNKVLRTIGNFPSCTPVRDLHTAFNLPYIYNYITIVQATSKVIQIYDNEHVRNSGQDEARHWKHEWLKLGGGQAYDRSSH
jgi:hypothetical protein